MSNKKTKNPTWYDWLAFYESEYRVEPVYRQEPFSGCVVLGDEPLGYKYMKKAGVERVLITGGTMVKWINERAKLMKREFKWK